MKLIKRDDMPKQMLPGRALQKAVGKESLVSSAKMTVGFATYSPESGPMPEPHHHAEETVYIASAKDGWVRFGPEKDQMSEPVTVETGQILHFPELEWHIFEFKEGGHVDAMFIYGQVDNIRPEEMPK